MRTPYRAFTWLGVVALSGLLACSSPAPVTSPEVIAVASDRLPLEPGDPSWARVPVHRAELLLQDMVEPRLLEPSTPDVEIRAMTDGVRIAFHLTWIDSTPDDLPGASRFVDACAVQLPVAAGADVPAPQMGEVGREVAITYWRASWQAEADGREDSIQALYPGATVDHYPFDAPSLDQDSDDQRRLAELYAPARALGNTMEGPRESPVQDLLAEGPGTLTPLAQQVSTGRGIRSGDGWQVVLVRPLPAALQSRDHDQVAVAIWDGARSEVGARKMRSGWVPLRQGQEP